MTTVLMFGCADKDADIKESIASNAKEDLAVVNYTVSNGVVTLSGSSPGEQLKQKLIKRLQSTAKLEKSFKKLSGNTIVDKVSVQ